MPELDNEDEGELVSPVHPVGLAPPVSQDLRLHSSILLGSAYNRTFGRLSYSRLGYVRIGKLGTVRLG